MSAQDGQTATLIGGQYVLGVDIGTSSAKVALIKPDGAIHRMHASAYTMRSSRSGWAELRADDWWETIVEGVRAVVEDVDPARIAGIGLSSAGGSVVLLDEEDWLLRPISLWLDARATSEAEELGENRGEDFWLRRTGLADISSLTVSKVLWLQRHEPEALSAAKTMLQTSDYVVYRMTGQAILDRSNGCSSGLYNLRSREWDEQILRAVGLAGELLPALEEPGIVAGALLPSAADALGLRSETPAVLGAWDQCCATVAAGTTLAGAALLSTGTAWVLCRPVPRKEGSLDPRAYTVQHAMPEQLLVMMPMSNAGSVAVRTNAGSSSAWTPTKQAGRWDRSWSSTWESRKKWSSPPTSVPPTQRRRSGASRTSLSTTPRSWQPSMTEPRSGRALMPSTRSSRRTPTSPYVGLQLLYECNHYDVPITEDNEQYNVNWLPENVDVGIIIVDENNVEGFFH